MASYANFINAEVQSHYANETYVNSLDKYSSLRLKFLPLYLFNFSPLPAPHPPFFFLGLFFFFLGAQVVPLATLAAASHEDCVTSLQSCFPTRGIYSCIVDFLIIFFIFCSWQVRDSS